MVQLPIRLSYLTWIWLNRPVTASPIFPHDNRLSSITQGLQIIHPRESSQADDSTCGFTGNPEIYGLGIRLGVYLQWTAFIVADFVSVDSDLLPGILDVDAAFLFAIFIATALLSSDHLAGDPVYAVETLIMLFFFFGELSIIVRMRGLSTSMSSFGFDLRSALFVGMSAFSVWYWFVGIYRLRKTLCGTFVFLFAKFNLYGKAKTFFRIASIAALALFGYLGVSVVSRLKVLILGPLLALPKYILGRSDLLKNVKWPGKDRRKGENHFRSLLLTLIWYNGFMTQSVEEILNGNE